MVFSKMSSGRRSLYRIISLVLVHTFVISSITFAAPQDKPIVNTPQEVVTNPESIVIPREFGIVKSKFGTDSGKLVVHIQDAHCNYEAQSNIVKILETLVKNDGLKLVSVEGADGVIDTSWFKAFPDDAVRKEVADYFMKKGEITGPEFLSITTDYPVKLFGAETRTYYLQNLNAFTSSYPLKADTEKYFNTIKSALNRLKDFIYNEDLKLMDSKNAEYESKKLPFNEYIRFLQTESEKNRINLREYDNFFKLVNVLIYEKKIDFSVTDKERTDLIDNLTKHLSKEGIAQLVTQSVSFKIGKISSADYYNYLKNLSLANGVDLAKDYPNLYNYIIYNSVYSKIENEKLFNDIKKVEIAIKEKLFANDDQRALEKLSRHIDILIGLVNIKLLNGDFDYYKSNKDGFTNEVFSDFIHKKAAQYGLVIEITPPTDAVAGSIAKLEDFYAIAIKRDKALVDNTIAQMQKDSQKIAVLVTGGFHSEGIAKLLETQGISYMVVCPSITKDVPTPYIQVLTNQRTSFEDIVMGAAETAATKQGMLAPASIAWAVNLAEKKELAKVCQSMKDLRGAAVTADAGTLEDRATRLFAEWTDKNLRDWITLAFQHAPGGFSRIANKEEALWAAYDMALDYRLSFLVSEGVVSADRAIAVKAERTGSADFKTRFHDAFGAAQPAGKPEAPNATASGAMAPTISSISRQAAAFQNPQAFYKEVAHQVERLYGLAMANGINIEQEIALCNAMPVNTDAERAAKEAAAKNIDNIIRRLLNATLVEEAVDASLANEASVNVVKQIDSIEAFKQNAELYKKYRDMARSVYLQSDLCLIDMFGGAASRLFARKEDRDPKKSFAAHDVYSVAVKNGYKTWTELLSSNALEGVSVAVRHMVWEWLEVEMELEASNPGKYTGNRDALIAARKEIIWNRPRIILINDTSGPSIVSEFVNNNFFGHNPDLVTFAVQATYNGYGLKSGSPIPIVNDDIYPAGHGDATLQAPQVGRGFRVNSKGEYIDLVDDAGNAISAEDYIIRKTGGRIRIMVEGRVNDMLKFGYSAKAKDEKIIQDHKTIHEINMDVLALALYKMDQGSKMVVEMVGKDPNIPMKGSCPISVVNRKGETKTFLVEGLAQSDLIGKLTGGEDVPFHRLFEFYVPGTLSEVARSTGLPVYLRFRDGKLYGETVTGDISMYLNAAFVRSDRRVLTDYKDGNLPAKKGSLRNGVDAALDQDNSPELKDKILDIGRARTGVSVSHLENTPVMTRQTPAGAIRLNGGELTVGEHRGDRGVNEAIAQLIMTGNAYAVVQGLASNQKDTDVPIRSQVPKDLTTTQLENFARVIREATSLGISLIAIKGLKDALSTTSAADLVFHPGISRKAIYVDEAELLFLLSLPNGYNLVMEAINHEMAHMRYSSATETEVESGAKEKNITATPSYNIRLALLERELSALEGAVGSMDANNAADFAGRLMRLSQGINVTFDIIAKTQDKDAASIVDKLLVRRSVLASSVAVRLIHLNATQAMSKVRSDAEQIVQMFLDGQVAKGNLTRAKANDIFNGKRDAEGKITTKGIKDFLDEWLDRNNGIPLYMVQGIYRGMLEARGGDIVFAFGYGWRKFGTAGIRNPAMQSMYPAIQQLEMEEFAKDPYAPTLPGPNMIDAVTLLQQEASMVAIMKDLQGRIARGDPSLSQFHPQFLEDVKGNRVTIAYDSRIEGEYFAKLLAAAFIADGIQVDLFDNAAGVPHLAWAANREHSAFGILISASHSEANYNGFKAFLGYQMSQVDELNKDMILGARDRVSYQQMHLDLAYPKTDLNAKLRGAKGLRWIGGAERIQGKDYLGREDGFVSFYPWYYEMVKARSPLALLPEEMRAKIESMKASPTTALRVLYTAFFGVGAKPAADFAGFLANQVNYVDVDTVGAQTDVMNGLFPGHKSPDPGIVQGWVSNLIDYIIQNAGEDFAGIDKAISALNTREVGVATDPDIDRAGVMIALPKGVRGNIKESLIAAVLARIQQSNKISQQKKAAVAEQVEKAMRNEATGLNDKFLMTANDAWTFMMFWKLRMMEETGKLEKDRVYIIEKSHVTTSALERVAKLYRDKGYKVFIVDTYVGFTEIGKKGRDLFAIADLSWKAYNILNKPEVDRTALASVIAELKKANEELKRNVPYQTAGVPIVTETLAMLEAIANGNLIQVAAAAKNLDMLSRMHILSGVEESNGYGELGRWNRETRSPELNHISDKDGSLAAFELLEIFSYGAYLNVTTGGLKQAMAPYDMYKDLIKAIGKVCTVNSALYHPGPTGVNEKLNEIEGIEKTFAYVIQQRLSRGEKVTLFNGRYEVKGVEVFRAGKNDEDYLSFPEEGIRIHLVNTVTKSESTCTYRPSGTGDSNRDYNWLLAEPPADGADFEAYKNAVDDETDVLVRDFYGVEGTEKGYVELTPEKFYGLLIALKEGGSKKQYELFGKALGQSSITLTPAEEALVSAVKDYVFVARKKATDKAAIAEKSFANRQAWSNYLATPEVVSAKGKLDFIINDRVVAQIPRAAMMAWQGGLVDYLIGLIEREGPGAQFMFPDEEVQTLITKRLSPIYKRQASSLRTIEEDIKAASKAVNANVTDVGKAFVGSVNMTMLLNDFAESVGIKKDVALKNMASVGLARIIDDKKGTYELTPGFFEHQKLVDFVASQVKSSDNPQMVDLTVLRIERIILNSINVNAFIAALAQKNKPSQTVEALENIGAFTTLTAAWKLDSVSTQAKRTVALRASYIGDEARAAAFYKLNGVDVEFSLPENAMVSPEALRAVQEYQAVMTQDMSRGAYNYRGAGTRQTIGQFYVDYFVPTWRGKIQDFVASRFSDKEPLKAIITNGIGANDQFMWSLVKMYNENKPAGAPTWYHVTTARDLAKLQEAGIKGENAVFIDISRSGSTWEGVEVGIRSLAMGFNKRIALANGGAVKAITETAARTGGYQPLVIGMSPDIGGRNMHRKTTIYYTAQTIAGMFMPRMDSASFMVLNDAFDKANDFARPNESVAVAAGKFLHASTRLMDVEHIAFLTNTEALRLAGTEWEQYIMEGSNKADVISMGIHDLTKEPEVCLTKLAAGPAGKKTIAMVLLDKAAKTYAKDLERVNALRSTMPIMVFTIDTGKNDIGPSWKGISPSQQAAFDILWTDLVTVFTTLLRVDANSNPNVKLVREYTASRVAKAKEAEAAYKKDPVGKGQADILVSFGTPANPKIGSDGEQVAFTPKTAAAEGRRIAAKLVADGLVKGRDRLNLFVGREDLMPLVGNMREYAYLQTNLVSEHGWLPQTAVFPLWSHKGLEANLAYSTNPQKPLLANKTINVFLNARQLGASPVYEQEFDNQGIMNDKYTGINGARTYQTNDAMTMPNVKRMAEVSPTLLFEFNDMTQDIEIAISNFYAAFLDELSKQLAAEKAASQAPKEKQVAAKEAAQPKAEAAKPAAAKATGKPEAPNVSVSGRPMTPREEYIYNTYVHADEDALRSTLISLGVDEQRQKKPVILVYDTGIEAEVNTTPVAKAAEVAINRYLDNTVVEIRGTGRALLEAVRAQTVAVSNEQAAKGVQNFKPAVVTITGETTLKDIYGQLSAEGKAKDNIVDDMGTVIQVQNPEGKYIPIIGLYDVALRIAYELDKDDIANRLNRIALNPDGTPFTKDNVVRGVIVILPRIKPVNTAEAVEAYKAAQQALQSL